MTRRAIPTAVKREVWARDNGTCVTQDCGATERLEYHHKTEVKLGGEDTVDNLELRCHDCHKRLTAQFAHNRKVTRKHGIRKPGPYQCRTDEPEPKKHKIRHGSNRWPDQKRTIQTRADSWGKEWRAKQS